MKILFLKIKYFVKNLSDGFDFNEDDIKKIKEKEEKENNLIDTTNDINTNTDNNTDNNINDENNGVLIRDNYYLLYL